MAKSERAALAEFSSMNHFGKLVRLNGLRRKNVLIGSRGGSAVSICSLNRWRLDLLNYTNSKYPSAGRAALRILPVRSPKPASEPGFASETGSQISDSDRLGSQTVLQLAVQSPPAAGGESAREGEAHPPGAEAPRDLGARPCSSGRYGVVLRRRELSPDLRRQPRRARCFCIN